MREQIITGEKIRHLELDPPVCIESGTTLSETISRMREQKQNCVLICKEGSCIGIFTERDILNKILGMSVDVSRPVDEFMSSNPSTLTTDDVLSEAILLMNHYGYRNVPLVNQEGKCAGLLRIRDIICYLSELYPEEVLNVPSSDVQHFSEPDGA